jgi:hypothetical protein
MPWSYKSYCKLMWHSKMVFENFENHQRHGLIKYVDTEAKCRHLNKLTCEGTLRQVFIRVYRLECGDTVSHVGIFDLLVNCCSSALLFVSTPPPLPCLNKYTVYTYTVSQGGMWFWASNR